MGFITFRDWLHARESSAFTRLRRDAALELKPPIPGASVHSRSTAHPFELKKLGKKKRKKKRKKLKILVGPITESKKNDTPPKDPKIDTFMNAIGALKHDVDSLKDVIEKKGKSPKPKPLEDKPNKEGEKEEKDEKDPKKKGEFAKYISEKDKEERKNDQEEDQRQKDVLKQQDNSS